MDPQDTSDPLRQSFSSVVQDQAQGVPDQLDPFEPNSSPAQDLSTQQTQPIQDSAPAPIQSGPTPPASLLTDEQKNSLFSELGLANLPDEKKEELMTQMIDTVLNRIFQRVLPSLSKEDTQALEDMGLREDGDSAIGSYLVSKVPNLDAIAQEEVEKFRTELKTSVSTIQAALPQQG